MSNWAPQGLQHARLPCPSPTLRACSNSCPWSQWCHQTISSSVIPFSCPKLSQHQGLFKWVSSLHHVAKVLEFQLQHQFSSVQLLSRVQLFAIPWIAARQASPCITNSRSSLRLVSIKSVIPSSHLIFYHPLLLLSPIPPSIKVCTSFSILSFCLFILFMGFSRQEYWKDYKKINYV